jgi:hypothetical protein
MITVQLLLISLGLSSEVLAAVKIYYFMGVGKGREECDLTNCAVDVYVMAAEFIGCKSHP